MTIELTDAERAYLLELLSTACDNLLHELHHTATADFKELLRDRLALAEALRARIQA